MKIASSRIFLALLTALVWSNASADEAWVDVLARVTSVHDPANVLGGQITFGQLFDGHYRYDSTAQPTYPAPNTANYTIPGFGAGLRLADGAVIFQSEQTFNPIGTVEVVDNEPNGGADRLYLSYQAKPLANGATVHYVNFNFYDSTGAALNTTALPTAAPELWNYSDRSINISGSSNSNMFYVTLQILSAHWAEPPTLQVSPQAGVFLPQQRFDAALYVPAFAGPPLNAQAFSDGQPLPLSYPGTCELAPPNSSGMYTIFCPDAHVALSAVPIVTQVQWRVNSIMDAVLYKVVDWKLLQ